MDIILHRQDDTYYDFDINFHRCAFYNSYSGRVSLGKLHMCKFFSAGGRKKGTYLVQYWYSYDATPHVAVHTATNISFTNVQLLMFTCVSKYFIANKTTAYLPLVVCNTIYLKIIII